MKAGAHFVEQPLSQLLFVETLERSVVASAALEAVAMNGPQAAFVRFEQDAPGRVFHQDLAGEFQPPTIHVGVHMFNGTGALHDAADQQQATG